MTELSPPRSVDPLTVLPRELAEQILGYLNFRQLMKTCLVSKEWAQFIHRTPNLWRHLDLTYARRKVKNAFVSRAINISRSKLKAATLSNLFEFDKALSALARTCPLEELNLRNTGLISSSVVDTLKIVKNLKILRIFKGTTLSKSALAQILSNASPTLEVLVCEDVSAHTPLEFQFPQVEFPNMRTLEMAWSSGSWRGSRSLVQSLPKMPHLQTLKLHQLANRETITHFLIDLTGLTQLSTLDLLIDVEQAKQIKLPPTIKSLAIGTWQRRIGAIFFASLHHDPLQWSLPLLEELKICAGEVPFGDFELALRTTDFSLTQTPAYLHTLSMTESDAAGSLTKETLSHPRLAELRHLSLESCHGVNDSHLSLVATTLPKLQTLNVSGTEVTGAGVKEVVKNGLKKLVASNCRFIGLDAIQWARTQGVHVENRNTDAMAGGRRVRHG
jgi:F-box/TPR repeat protein Pof3